MSRTAQPLQPVEYAILGLLLIAPRHGYELAARFSPDAELGAAVSVGLSELYAVLKRLEARGLVAGQVEARGVRPPRHVYHLTPAGEEEFRRWLNRPVRRNREVRLDFVLKLYCSALLPEHDTRALVADQLAACREQLARLEAERDSSDPSDFGRLMRQLRQVATRGTIEWLEAAAAPYAAAASRGEGATPNAASGTKEARPCG